MKHLKIYEGYVKNLAQLTDISKFKKFMIFTEFDDYFLDKLLEIENTSDTLKVQTIAFYNNLTEDITFPSDEIEEIHFAYSDDVIFSSNDYEQTKKHFETLVETHRDAKKYNL